MVKTVTPFSTRAKEGATDSPLGDFVEVPQTITSTANAGFYDTTGKLRGIQSSDKLFVIDPIHEAVANGATVLSPQKADHEYIDMTGFSVLLLALKVSNAGNFALEAVMGPDTYPFANLTPVNAASAIRIMNGSPSTQDGFNNAVQDGAEALAADVWNIFRIADRLSSQKLLQFKITNNSGGPSNITFASLRVV